MNEPTVILVDTNDNAIGAMPKSEAHKKPHLHRAFSVFLHNGNKMLIQQRAKNKYHSPEIWANSCCSHPRPNEKLSEAVQNRMLEEIGFNCPVNEIFEFIYIAKFNDNLFEYEYDHVFLGEYKGEYTLNPEEAMDAKWIDIDELEKDLVENPQKYSVWFISAAPRVIAEIRKKL